MREMIVSGLVGAFVVGALHIIGAEAAGRTRFVLNLLIRCAAHRLPEEFRAEFADEWRAEADSILAESRALPATRAWRALCYCLSLVRASSCFGVALTEQPTPMREAIQTVGTDMLATGVDVARIKIIAAAAPKHLDLFVQRTARDIQHKKRPGGSPDARDDE